MCVNTQPSSVNVGPIIGGIIAIIVIILIIGIISICCCRFYQHAKNTGSTLIQSHSTLQTTPTPPTLTPTYLPVQQYMDPISMEHTQLVVQPVALGVQHSVVVQPGIHPMEGVGFQRV